MQKEACKRYKNLSRKQKEKGQCIRERIKSLSEEKKREAS